MDDLQVFNFGKVNIPQPWESRETSNERFVWWGIDNLYPNYLLKLYTESPIHSSIVNNKANYIIGDGLKSADGQKLQFNVNASDNIDEFVAKVVKDYLIGNSFAVEVVYNTFNQPIEYHFIPFHKLRTNINKTKFWFNDDWRYRRKQIVFDRWSQQSKDTTSKIFYFDGYFPSVHNVYPTPEYIGANLSIETDISIRNFNLNHVKNQFSVSSIITFYNGQVTEDVKRTTLKAIQDTYTGENGGNIMIDFQNATTGKPADVKPLSAGEDWANKYNATRDSVADDIYRGHQVVSPSLFGVKTAGQLGGSQELETAYEIFKKNYIAVKRAELESALNMLFTGFEQVNGRVAFSDKQLFTTLPTATKEKVYTINELRAEAGLPALPNGDRLLSEVPKVSESVKPGDPLPTVPVEQSDDTVVKKKSKKLTEDDFELIKHLGVLMQDFEELELIHPEGSKLQFSAEEDVAKYVVDNDIKNLTVDQLNELISKEAGVDVSTSELKNILNKLNDSGVLKVSYKDGKVDILPNKIADVPDTDRVQILYKYTKRPDVPGGDLLPTSRGFCTKLINNGRYYTREEIQQMSQLFEYDVMNYAGGFYYNPETDETTPYCRHMWQAVRVKSKRK